MEALERRYAWRWMAAILLGVLALNVVVLAKLIRLHVYEYAPRDYTMEFSLLGLRGRILDRNGNVLATSLPGREVYVDRNDPKFKALPEERQASLPHELATLLGVSEEVMHDAFHGARKGSVKVCEISDDAVIRHLDEHASASVPAEERIAGVNFYNKISVRAHPNGASMSHVIGFTNREGVGVYGVEQRFDELLKGVAGHVATVGDARRREIRDRRMEEVAPIHGADVYLTLDATIQNIIERALSEGMRACGAGAGTIIVQDVTNGEILGMASLPTFNPAEYGSFAPELWKNAAISRNYEPGSVMKVITVATALQNDIITERSQFDVGTSRIWYYAGRPLKDTATGILTPQQILERSSNIGTAQIGIRFSETLENPFDGSPMKTNELLWNAFRSMGVGSLTGIELVGEEAGILPHYSKWSKLSPTRMTLGQGVAMTPLQLCNAYATIGNMGVRLKPTILREVRKHGSEEVIMTGQPAMLGRPLRAEVCRKMLEMMTTVTEGARGTGKRARVPSYYVAGKTGTAQIPINGSYDNKHYNVTFVGIYPATAPRLTILVTFENPTNPERMGGGSAAAPVFAAVAEDIGRYLSIPPDKPLEEEP